MDDFDDSDDAMVMIVVLFLVGVGVGMFFMYQVMNARRSRPCNEWTVKEYQLKVEPARCFK